MKDVRRADIQSDAEETRFRRLFERNPTSTIFARLADVRLAAGDTAGAIDVCRKGLRYRPSYITGHLVLGRAYLADGDLTGAEEEFQKALRLEPDNPAATWYLGELAAQSGQAERAEGYRQRLTLLDVFAVPTQAPTEPDHEQQEVQPEEEPVSDQPVTAEQNEAGEAYPFLSMTLAKLYANQGHRGRAEQVVRAIYPETAEDKLGQLSQEIVN